MSALANGIFLVPVLDRWLLYSPLQHVTALVNNAVVVALKNGRPPDGSGRLGDLWASLRVDPEKEPQPPTGPPRPEFLGIIPTRACNLACVYCGFGASESRPDGMDLRLAVAAVDWIVEHSRRAGRSGLEVHFFGGEPFSAPDVVDVAVHRARDRAAQAGLLPRFEVATNGCFDEDRCRFVGNYFNTVVLSLDGPEEVHNRHRPTKTGQGSYATVARNARFLSQSSSELCIRCCVTQDTVGSLDRITRWFCETFQPSTITFETLQPSPESDLAGLRPPDPWEFAIMWVRSSYVALGLGVTLVYGAALLDSIRHSFCPVGRDSLIVSPEGRVSACYLPEQEWRKRGLDLNLGNFDRAGNISLDRMAIDRVRNVTACRPRCQRCLARWHCAGGCHVNHSYPGCADSYDDFCIQTRVITACRLLERMGCKEEVQGLLNNRPALENLALHSSDRLADWGNHDD